MSWVTVRLRATTFFRLDVFFATLEKLKKAFDREDVQVTQFGFHLRIEKMLHFFLLFLSFAQLSISSQSESIEDQIPEDSSIVTYLTKLPTVWFNVWKFLDQPKNSPRSNWTN